MDVSGYSLEGEWKNHVKEGKFILIDPSLHSFETQFENNEIVDNFEDFKKKLNISLLICQEKRIWYFLPIYYFILFFLFDQYKSFYE